MSAPDAGGRPPIEGRPLSTFVKVRCLEDQLERWRAAAEAEGLALSAWIRRELEAAAAPAPTPPASET